MDASSLRPADTSGLKWVAADVDSTVMTDRGIYLPTPMIMSGQGIPARCVLHGEPANATRKVRFYSKPPMWTYLLLLLSIGIAVIVMLVIRKKVAALRWPFCARCLVRRRTFLLAMWACLAAIPLCFVAANLSSDSTSSSTTWLVLVGVLILPLAALTFGQYSRWSVLAPGTCDSMATSVNFRKPAIAFVDDLNALHAAAVAQNVAR